MSNSVNEIHHQMQHEQKQHSDSYDHNDDFLYEDYASRHHGHASHSEGDGRHSQSGHHSRSGSHSQSGHHGRSGGHSHSVHYSHSSHHSSSGSSGHSHHHRIRKRKIRILPIVVIVLVTIVVSLAGTLLITRSVGKKHLMEPVAGSAEIQIDLGVADADSTEEVSTEQALKAGQVLYKGKVYERNEDMITILVMGIDKESVQTVGGESWESFGVNNGGQADANFLVLINPHNETVRIVSINRNSMVDVDVWDEEGNYIGVFTRQLAVQHAYGDGGAESCEHQVKAVSRMFHGIPINAYAAIEMDAIPEMNDAVGGVTVDVLQDIVRPKDKVYLYEGTTVTLEGLDAYYYLRHRDTSVFGSSDDRLVRQKQYISAFVQKLKELSLSDIGVALDLYRTLQRYMVTDIDQSSFTYMATEFLDYRYELNDICSIEGETIMGEQFEEYYVDDDALQDLIIELFYEPVS